MATDREQLQDAFDRAEGAQEIAFRNWQRATRHNTSPLIQAALVKGAKADAEIERLAPKLSQPSKG